GGRLSAVDQPGVATVRKSEGAIGCDLRSVRRRGWVQGIAAEGELELIGQSILIGIGERRAVGVVGEGVSRAPGGITAGDDGLRIGDAKLIDGIALRERSGGVGEAEGEGVKVEVAFGEGV